MCCPVGKGPVLSAHLLPMTRICMIHCQSMSFNLSSIPRNVTVIGVDSRLTVTLLTAVTGCDTVCAHMWWLG